MTQDQEPTGIIPSYSKPNKFDHPLNAGRFIIFFLVTKQVKQHKPKKDFFSQRLVLLVHFRQLVASCFIGLVVLPHVPSTLLGLLVSYVLVKLRKSEKNTHTH